MLKKPVRTRTQLLTENEDLRARLDEANEVLYSIRSGEVDALLVSGAGGDQLYTLKGANRSYRVLIEEMNEGALTVTTDGVILYANRRCAEILKAPLETVIGSTINAWVAPADQKILQSLLRKSEDQKRREELALTASDGTVVPVFLSASNLLINETPASFFCLVVTDLTEQKRSEAIAAAETLARELLAASNQARLALLSMVEDLKRTEEALRASEEKYRRLVDEVNDGFYVTDEAGIFTFANPALARIYGVEAPQLLLGRKFSDFLASEKPAVLSEPYGHAMQTGSAPEVINGQIMRPDGKRTFIEVKTAMIKERDKIVGTRGVVRDITERKQAEIEIQRQIHRLRSLRTIDAAISSSFDLRVILEVVLQQTLSQLEVDASAILLFNTQSQTMEYAASRGFHSDILHNTRLKLGEGYAGRAMLARKTIHIADGVAAGGKLGSVLQLEHESFVDYYAAPLIVKGEVIGVLEIYHRSVLQGDPDWLEFLETLAGEAAIAFENAQLFDHLQRSNIELEQRVAKRTEELKKTNIELEHANSAKDEFLATMSHELRTPLNSVLGLSETLLEQGRDPLSAYQLRSIQIIESSGRHLLELINDVLDLSKIEVGKLDYYPQAVDVDNLCHSSLAFIREQALRKFVTITYKREGTVSKIYADPRRLKQILVNLLSNAVKFTPSNGEVTLLVEADVEQDRIQFSIVDTGIGIAAEDLKKLFQPFVQVDSRLTREYEGTGLGLALVHRLTDLHGGSVSVESEVGKGSRFTVNLGIGQALIAQQGIVESGGRVVDQVVHKPAAQPLELITILLVEDNMSNILTVGDYLAIKGYQVIVAHDGVEALEQAEAHQPDMILMDIQMPGMDGLEAIHHLRANPRFASTPIIALTALAMPGDRERCLAAGASEYMSKPVILKTLAKTVESMLNPRRGFSEQ